jgi:hypothetical protein
MTLIQQARTILRRQLQQLLRKNIDRDRHGLLPETESDSLPHLQPCQIKQRERSALREHHRIQHQPHHCIKAVLALLGGPLGVAAEVVGDGADREGFGAVLGGEAVEARGFHLDAEDVHRRERVDEVRVGP